MKRKFSKILGVGLTLALLTSLLLTAAPVSALTLPAVTLATGTETISSSNTNYTITFELGKELAGATTYTLPDNTDSFRITDSGAGTDVATITIATAGTVGVTMVNGTYTVATGVIAFTAAGGTATIAANSTAGASVKWTPTTGTATAAALIEFDDDVTGYGAGPAAFTLPDVGDAIRFTDSGAGTDVVTLTLTTGTIGTPVFSGLGTYAAGVITFGTANETCDITAATPVTTASWARTTGTATSGLQAEIDEDITTVSSGDSITATFPVGTTIKSPFGAGNISLPDAGDVVTILDATTDALAGDSGVIYITTGAVAITGTGTIGTAAVTAGNFSTWATDAGETIIITVTTLGVTGDWTATTGTGAMTVTTDADLDVVIPAATIGGGPGWIGGTYVTAVATIANVTWAVNATLLTLTATLGVNNGTGVRDAIGETADVRINLVNCIQNPGTTGTNYTLTVATSQETTAITSAPYAITDPTILPLAGVVERYNSVGVLMAQTRSIQTAINNAAVGDSINVGAGTYDEDITISKSVTVTGNAATTIIKDTDGLGTGGTVTISYVGTATTGAVLDGFTVMGRPGVTALNITGHKVTVQNCTFTKAGTATTAAAQNMINYAPGALPTLASTITNCTFDTTLGTVVDNGILIAAGANAIGLTVSNSTFTVDGAIGAEDSAINTAGVGTILLPITISDNTITGGSGIGVTVTAGVVTISDSTLTGLNQAFNVVSGTATIKGNTIDNCGLAIVTTTAPVGKAAINVTAATALSITNNNIINSPNDIIEIVDNSENINMMFNNLTDNAKGIDNDDANILMTLNATHNWWGVATGPATDFNVTAGAVNDTTAYLGGVATGSFTAGATAITLLTKTTVGVDVIPTTAAGVAWVPVAGDIIGVANYAANPQGATPYPAIADGFYDVVLVDTTAQLGATSQVLIKFYNANVTANTAVYVWGTVAGGWQAVTAANQGVNLFEGFAYATIGPLTTPSITGLAGTPFALVEAPVTAIGNPILAAPDIGADDVALRPTFSWTQIAAADGYYFELADNANFVVPLVKLDGDLGRLIVTAYAYAGELPYSTAYYWRVKAVSGTVAAGDLAQSAWVSGVFITMDEPEEPTPPIVIEDVPAPIIEQPDIIIESPDIIVPLPDVAAPITPTWIYVIIGVGAMLVIALLVLIVRTRRVA